MLNVNSQLVVATVRTAVIYAWTWALGLLLSLPAVAEFPELGNFLANVGDLLTGSGVILVGTVVYAALYKLAQMDNALGNLLSFVFIFPVQPEYTIE
jgi:hypothetical protein